MNSDCGFAFVSFSTDLAEPSPSNDGDGLAPFASILNFRCRIRPDRGATFPKVAEAFFSPPFITLSGSHRDRSSVLPVRTLADGRADCFDSVVVSD